MRISMTHASCHNDSKNDDKFRKKSFFLSVLVDRLLLAVYIEIIEHSFNCHLRPALLKRPITHHCNWALWSGHWFASSRAVRALGRLLRRLCCYAAGCYVLAGVEASAQCLCWRLGDTYFLATELRRRWRLSAVARHDVDGLRVRSLWSAAE